MDAISFCYWLQGLFEIGNPKQLSAKQVKMIKKHLALVFTNVTNQWPITTTSDKTIPLPRITSDIPYTPWQPDDAWRPTIICEGGNAQGVFDHSRAVFC